MIFSALIPIKQLYSSDLNRKRLLETEITLGEAHRKFDIDSTQNLLSWINYYLGYEGIPQILVFENSKILETEINERIKKGASINDTHNEICIRNGIVQDIFTGTDISEETKESFFVNFNHVDKINYYRIMNDNSSIDKVFQPCIFELLFKELDILILQTESFEFSADCIGNSSFFGKIDNFRAIVEAYEIETVYSDIVKKISDLYRKSYVHQMYYSPFLTLVSKYPFKSSK